MQCHLLSACETMSSRRQMAFTLVMLTLFIFYTRGRKTHSQLKCLSNVLVQEASRTVRWCWDAPYMIHDIHDIPGTSSGYVVLLG